MATHHFALVHKKTGDLAGVAPAEARYGEPVPTNCAQPIIPDGFEIMKLDGPDPEGPVLYDRKKKKLVRDDAKADSVRVDWLNEKRKALVDQLAELDALLDDAVKKVP